jgi:hypothetical protein
MEQENPKTDSQKQKSNHLNSNYFSSLSAQKTTTHYSDFI